MKRDTFTLDDIGGRLTITVDEAGRLLGLGRDAAYRAANAGDIPTLRLGRRILVPVPKLLAMLQPHAVESALADSPPPTPDSVADTPPTPVRRARGASSMLQAPPKSNMVSPPGEPREKYGPDTPLANTLLTMRAVNVLARAGMRTVWDVLSRDVAELAELRNLRPNEAWQIIKHLNDHARWADGKPSTRSQIDWDSPMPLDEYDIADLR